MDTRGDLQQERYLGLLEKVEKPARYIGMEWNSVVKGDGEADLRVALAFPDLYEIGMSYLGMKILYHVLNGMAGVAAERVFSPWTDYEGLLSENGLPLLSLETKRPLRGFDIVGFSLSYEMNFTNVLQILALSGIPLMSAERGDEMPLIIAGGPAAFNPEPLADFIDAFLIGDGEEAFPEIVEVSRAWKRGGRKGRPSLLKALSHIGGVYVPSFYEPVYNGGEFAGMKVVEPGAPASVKKRLVADLDAAPFPTAPVVPYISVVHDRISLEVMRGCPHRCRFCQAASIYAPVRLRSVDTLMRQMDESIAKTGYDEVSLLSLSTADYPRLEELLTRMTGTGKSKGVHISLPSLRVDDVIERLPHLISRIKKTGLTIAPEVGSERLRRLIDKNIDTSALLGCAGEAFAKGWLKLKLYFMVGFPGETMEDINGIIALGTAVSEIGRRNPNRRAEVTMSVSPFMPKPHTPFQWEGMRGLDYFLDLKKYIYDKVRNKRIKLDFHDPRLSLIEGALSRGDRRVGRAVLRAFENGARFDGWTERFSYGRWTDAFASAGLDLSGYLGGRTRGVALPWAHIVP